MDAFSCPQGDQFLWGLIFLESSGWRLTDYILCYAVLLSNRYFNEEGDVIKEEEFTPEVLYHPAERAGSWDVEGDRVITLGTNM